MTKTDLLIEAMRREAEYRRPYTDADPSLVEVTVTVKIDAQQQVRGIFWEPKYHRPARRV
jgi:hypothetical protein